MHITVHQIISPRN